MNGEGSLLGQSIPATASYFTSAIARMLERGCPHHANAKGAKFCTALWSSFALPLTRVLSLERGATWQV